MIMDSIKESIVRGVKTGIAKKFRFGAVIGHSDATAEYQEGEDLNCFLRVTHPSIQGHRLFEVRVKEIR